jgi:hypothetical protein
MSKKIVMNNKRKADKSKGENSATSILPNTKLLPHAVTQKMSRR